MAGRFLLFLLLAAASALGQDDPKRLDALEKENQELRQRVGNLEDAKAADEKEQQEALAREVQHAEEEGLGLNMVVRRGSVWGIFQLFGDTGFNYLSPELANRGTTYFFDGSVDLFFTARVGDHFQVLSETVFQTAIGATVDTSKWDQERLWGAWQFSDLVQVKLGLEHGPISRWNNLYHHGRWLELTITRPFIARFEGDGGILPMHEAGIEILGSFEAGGKVRISYVLFFSNGRGPQVTDVEEFSDHNDSKAITGGFGFEPMGGQPLFIGIFARWDEIPPNSADPARIHSIGQFVGVFQVDYRGERVQILSELGWITDDDRTSSTDFDHFTGYIQFGYALNDEWTPYFRFDVRDMDNGDPYYSPVNRDLDIYEIVTGVRFDFLDNVAIKLEIGFGEREQRDSGGVVSDQGYIRVGLQLSFVF
jgi:hypothetical protein